MSSIFTKIINKEIQAHLILETNMCLAFLDINPIVLGHVLVVPKLEVDYIFDLPNIEYLELMACAKEVSKAIKKATHCNRVGIGVSGFNIPHAHVHLIPINKTEEMACTNKPLKVPSIVLEAIAISIRKQLT